MYNKKAIALFKDWDEALIWSCLQGYMGRMIVDDESNPQSAIIDNGFFVSKSLIWYSRNASLYSQMVTVRFYQ